MAEWPPDAERDAGKSLEHSSRPGVPRWVTVLAVVTLVLVLLVAVALFTGDGHGPSRHDPPAAGTHAGQSSIVTSDELLR